MSLKRLQFPMQDEPEKRRYPVRMQWMDAHSYGEVREPHPIPDSGVLAGQPRNPVCGPESSRGVCLGRAYAGGPGTGNAVAVTMQVGSSASQAIGDSCRQWFACATRTASSSAWRVPIPVEALQILDPDLRANRRRNRHSESAAHRSLRTMGCSAREEHASSRASRRRAKANEPNQVVSF
jgi:hypothetical protein